MAVSRLSSESNVGVKLRVAREVNNEYLQVPPVRFKPRGYDPTVGRWTSKDPNLFGGGQANIPGLSPF